MNNFIMFSYLRKAVATYIFPEGIGFAILFKYFDIYAFVKSEVSVYYMSYIYEMHFFQSFIIRRIKSQINLQKIKL